MPLLLFWVEFLNINILIVLKGLQATVAPYDCSEILSIL